MKCWRCDKELPKLQTKRKRDPQKSAQVWLYVVAVAFLLFTLLQTCGVKMPWSAQPKQGTTGLVVPAEPVNYGLPALA